MITIILRFYKFNLADSIISIPAIIILFLIHPALSIVFCFANFYSWTFLNKEHLKGIRRAFLIWILIITTFLVPFSVGEKIEPASSNSSPFLQLVELMRSSSPSYSEHSSLYLYLVIFCLVVLIPWGRVTLYFLNFKIYLSNMIESFILGLSAFSQLKEILKKKFRSTFAIMAALSTLIIVVLIVIFLRKYPDVQTVLKYILALMSGLFFLIVGFMMLSQAYRLFKKEYPLFKKVKKKVFLDREKIGETFIKFKIPYFRLQFVKHLQNQNLTNSRTA